jgi:hypothetical protein
MAQAKAKVILKKDTVFDAATSVSRVVWDSVAVVMVAVTKRVGMLDRLPPERDRGANTFSLSA